MTPVVQPWKRRNLEQQRTRKSSHDHEERAPWRPCFFSHECHYQYLTETIATVVTIKYLCALLGHNQNIEILLRLKITSWAPVYWSESKKSTHNTSKTLLTRNNDNNRYIFAVLIEVYCLLQEDKTWKLENSKPKGEYSWTETYENWHIPFW